MNKPLTEGKTRGQIKPLRKGSNPLPPSGTRPPPPPNPPNQKTIDAMNETNLKKFDTIDELMDDLTDKSMKMWSHTKFKGHWPVGTAAIVIAETREEAGFIFNEELDRRGLPFCDPDQFEEIPIERGTVRVLCDGDY